MQLCDLTIGFILFQFFPYQIISLFGKGDELYYEFAIHFYAYLLIYGYRKRCTADLLQFLFCHRKATRRACCFPMTRQVFFLIPLVLIILDSLAGVVGIFSTPVAGILGFLGEPFVALLIATLVAMYFLGTRHGYTLAELEKILTKSLEPTGLIL